MQKSKPVAYIAYKIRTTDRYVMLEFIDHAPLDDTDRMFVIDIISGSTYKDLADKYNLSESGVYQKKRRLYEALYAYEMIRH